MNTDELLKQARRTLVDANERFGYQGDEYDQAWDLLVHAWGEEPQPDDEVPSRVRQRFGRLLKRRATGEPLAYIIGWIDFGDFRLDIKPGMFVPRLTSEFLAEQAIRRLRCRRQPIHVDVATGIGPVAISSALAVPHARVVGLDISQKALNQARANAAHLGAVNVSFKRSDMFSGLGEELRGLIDVVTIHPPYVPKKEVADLAVEIKRFEPRHTLTDGSTDGLGLVRRVIDEGAGWIRPAGWLLIEIVASEFKRIRPLMRSTGFCDIRSTKGPLGLTRVIVGRAPL